MWSLASWAQKNFQKELQGQLCNGTYLSEPTPEAVIVSQSIEVLNQSVIIKTCEKPQKKKGVSEKLSTTATQAHIVCHVCLF